MVYTTLCNCVMYCPHGITIMVVILVHYVMYYLTHYVVCSCVMLFTLCNIFWKRSRSTFRSPVTLQRESWQAWAECVVCFIELPGVFSLVVIKSDKGVLLKHLAVEHVVDKSVPPATGILTTRQRFLSDTDSNSDSGSDSDTAVTVAVTVTLW